MKRYNLSEFLDVDEINNSNIQDEKVSVKYLFSYDSENNVVTLTAILIDSNNEPIIDNIVGEAFTNEMGNIDARLEIEDEIILLSELQNAGMIENCGWFSRLITKVVVATVSVIVVAAVVSTVAATAGLGLGAVIAVGAAAGAVTGAVAGGVISYTEYGKLDWRWIVGGAVVGGAIGAVVGWGVGGSVMETTTAKTNQLIRASKNGKLDFSNSIKNKSYFKKGSYDYRQYYEQTNLISQEIMKSKPPTIESNTKYLKWTVEAIQQTAKDTTYGKWELIIDPVKQVIVHFLFAS